MATTETVKGELATREGNGQVQQPGPMTALWGQLERMRPQFEMVLAKHLDSERFIRLAFQVFRTNPDLQKCTPESFLGAVMTCAQTGLEPGPLGHAYIVRYGQAATFIPGYRGLIELARRSGNIEAIIAREVYEHDKFQVRYGLDDTIEHEPQLFGDRGQVIAYYAIAKYVGGGHAFVVLTKQEVEKFRKRSRASDEGPWQTDYDAMAKKTCVRRLAAYLPLSVEMSAALSQDEQVRTDLTPTALDAAPVYDAETVDQATGEIAGGEPIDAEVVENGNGHVPDDDDWDARTKAAQEALS